MEEREKHASTYRAEKQYNVKQKTEEQREGEKDKAHRKQFNFTIENSFNFHVRVHVSFTCNPHWDSNSDANGSLRVGHGSNKLAQLDEVAIHLLIRIVLKKPEMFRAFDN